MAELIGKDRALIEYSWHCIWTLINGTVRRAITDGRNFRAAVYYLFSLVLLRIGQRMVIASILALSGMGGFLIRLFQ